MPKPYTFPTLYDEVLQINIAKLKEWGYLNPEQVKNGTLNWSRNGNPIGSISIHANTRSTQPYVRLNYTYRGKPRKYKIDLTATPSNLNRGKIWYFLCPQTKKRCRKLYLVEGYFLHREAFSGCMYQCQTESRKERLIRQEHKVFWQGNEHDQLNAKFLKTHYRGKPTRTYLRITKKIKKALHTAGINK